MLDIRKTVFVLGAKDPEMDVIEEILSAIGLFYIYARARGHGRERVTHASAYDAVVCDSDRRHIREHGSKAFMHIECDVPLHKKMEGVSITAIDHHRLGDPGFDKPYAAYWEGSSLGQLCEFLRIKHLPWIKERFDMSRLHLIAAIDHARFWAVRGECPGIAAEDAQHESKRQIAESFGVSPFAVEALTRSYYDVLAKSPTIRIGGRPVKDVRQYDLGDGYSFDFLVLQEAAMLLGTPYIALQKWSGGAKVFLNRVDDPTTVEAFMNEWAPREGLTNIFGVPLRGYAGGTVSS